jgi:hypothetical protein
MMPDETFQLVSNDPAGIAYPRGLEAHAVGPIVGFRRHHAIVEFRSRYPFAPMCYDDRVGKRLAIAIIIIGTCFMLLSYLVFMGFGFGS